MGEKTYSVRFHAKVIKEDLPNLSPIVRKSLMNFILNKLKLKPFLYGRPLRSQIGPYWKVRIGNYILGFKIIDQILLILSIIPFYKLYNSLPDSERKLH